MEENATRVIVVLGMHRSGTSVITRGLQVMGVELGDHLMPPFEGNNSRGFWEDVDINALNIEMLHSLNSDWHHLTPIQPADVDTLCAHGFLQRATELLQEKTADRDVFGFKDPRVAKLLPFWNKVFIHGSWQVSYVLVIRHPLSVCHSLAKRDALEFEKSYLLWLEHVMASLVGTKGKDRVLVDYDHFMQLPEAGLTRIAQELQLSMDTTEFHDFQAEFLDPELQHTIYPLSDLLNADAPPLVQEVYSSLLDPATGKADLETPLFRDKIAQWENEFSRLHSILVFADKLSVKLMATTAHRNILNAERTALLAERDALLHEKAQLAQAVKEQAGIAQRLQAELTEIYRSRSWHWTNRLRKLSALFKRPD